MKITRLLFALVLTAVSTAVLAQNLATPACPVPPPPAAADCQSTCVICDLNYYWGNNQGNVPTTNMMFCGQIVTHNPVWHGFVAGSQFIGFQINTSNCWNGDGFQAAIFKSCDDQEPIVCFPGTNSMAGVPIDIFFDDFEVGATYYLMLDGFAGDICDYEIQVTIGTTTAPVPGPTLGVTGLQHICPGTVTEYTTPEVPFASYYQWTAPAGAKINGLSNNVTLDPLSGQSVLIEFGNTSGSVCVKAGSVCYSAPVTSSCLSVQSVPIPPTILPMEVVPFDQLPYIWPESGETLAFPGTFTLTTVYESFIGCDSVVRQTIKIQPPPEGDVVGFVYWDADQDGIFDPGEVPYPNGAVVSISSGFVLNTDAQGKYVFPNVPPGDTIRVAAPLPGLTITPAFRIKQAGIWSGYNFGLSPAPLNYDLSVTTSELPMRPGFLSSFFITCKNNGPSAVPDVAVAIEIPLDLLDLIEFSPANANLTIVGNSLSWQVGLLTPGQIKSLNIKVLVPVATPLGTQLTYQAQVTPIDDDYLPTNNFSVRTATVVGSYDPNDKQVTPPYVTPGMLSNGQPFEYTIRFQNTGTYPAEFVRVIDSLGSLVDPATFRFVAASHPCTWTINGKGVIEFFFDNIQLPDSTSDEAGSHGFVRFTVMPKKNLALGTVIENFCDIYFDFNPPIRTNTAGTQVVYFLPGAGLSVRDALIVRPNPAAFHIFCNWQTPAPADGRIRLFDVMGLPRLEIPVVAGQTDLSAEVQFLDPGLYFVVMESGNLLLNNKVVILKPGILGAN